MRKQLYYTRLQPRNERNPTMNCIFNSVEEMIGHTPLLKLNHIEKEYALQASLYAKIESKNPGGSIKDRVALEMINEAEQNGTLSPGGTIIEPTSGNTGIGLAMISAVRGYQLIIVMPDSMSEERKTLMKAYGAKLVLTDGALGMSESIQKAEELHRSIPGSFIPGQFTSPANPEAHRKTTGPEIWKDLDGKVDILVAGVGTGGTLTGTGSYLKSQNPQIRIVAVEPASSPVLSQGKSGSHGIQGIGAGFIPDVLDLTIYDEVFPVTDEQSFETARLIAVKEGLLVGISSGAAVFSAIELAKNPDNRGKNIVVVLPDTGDHYLSSHLFD